MKKEQFVAFVCTKFSEFLEKNSLEKCLKSTQRAGLQHVKGTSSFG